MARFLAMSEQESEVAATNLERARALVEELGYETGEIPERLPFPAFVAHVAIGGQELRLPHADLVFADSGDRIQLILPNVDRLVDDLGLTHADESCRRVLEAAFGYDWARASLDASDGELRLSATIPLAALDLAHLREAIEELSELLLAYWVGEAPVHAHADLGALPN
jgi:hypothetical protein